MTYSYANTAVVLFDVTTSELRQRFRLEVKEDSFTNTTAFIGFIATRVDCCLRCIDFRGWVIGPCYCEIISHMGLKQ